ncbi:unnamed protein product [Nesidiocoris tenuis]|uniref:Uncharacterized protein n=1 Tax=Nesidiocoris tenuis TaxID=355587 RepID=A0A6H5HJD1_9HEMI|nr:unnamed protein product [Nesidiocoris tenuis]CAB0016577.1 unnamed protein product [Nesidiocoris tenuis]
MVMQFSRNRSSNAKHFCLCFSHKVNQIRPVQIAQLCREHRHRLPRKFVQGYPGTKKATISMAPFCMEDRLAPRRYAGKPMTQRFLFNKNTIHYRPELKSGSLCASCCNVLFHFISFESLSPPCETFEH